MSMMTLDGRPQADLRASISRRIGDLGRRRFGSGIFHFGSEAGRKRQQTNKS
jgi:hypothetical protein